MHLAKPHLDVGFSTNDWEAARHFWGDTVGLAYEEYLKIGSGVRQHRFGVHGSVVKVNHAREPLADAPTAYLGVRIASATVTEPVALATPDGTAVSLVPPGHDDIVGIEVAMAVADADTARRFWVDGLGGTALDEHRVRVGDTVVRLVPEPGRAPMTTRSALGFRYLTVQVHDVDTEHARMVALDFAEEFPPVTLGTTARISFVRDPDGGYLEISQRASLTGPLPDR